MKSLTLKVFLAKLWLHECKNTDLKFIPLDNCGYSTFGIISHFKYFAAQLVLTWTFLSDFDSVKVGSLEKGTWLFVADFSRLEPLVRTNLESSLAGCFFGVSLLLEPPKSGRLL